MTALAAALQPHRSAPPLHRFQRDVVYTQPATAPPALVEGYRAARAGQPATTNPYALGLPCDSESHAMLWDDGFHVGSRHPHCI